MSDRLPGLSDFATGTNSAYPELWENCIGAWAPSLGPTGGIIPDRTGLTPPAEVINPSTGQNYQVNDGVYCFDAIVASSTYVKTNLNRANTVTQLTWAFWGRLHPGTAFYVSDLSSSRGFGIDNLGTLIYLNYPGAANYAQIAVNTTDGWFHFAYVFNGNGGTDAERIKLYINGTERTLTYVGATPTSLLTTTEPLQIGRRPYAITQTPGLWDDFRAYSVALDPARIRLLASQRGIAYTPKKRRFAIDQPAGGALNGSSSITFTGSGSITGVANLVGSSGLTFNVTGSATPLALLSGSSSLTFIPSASISASALISGATALTFTTSGTLASPGVMSGSTSLTFSATGNCQAIPYGFWIQIPGVNQSWTQVSSGISNTWTTIST